MPTEVFTDSSHCSSGEHCDACRNLVGGRSFRESLVPLFVLPNNDVDFECPYGKKWGHETPQKLAHEKHQPKKTADEGCIPCARKKARQKALEARANQPKH